MVRCDVAGFNAHNGRFHLAIAGIAGIPFLEYDVVSLHDRVQGIHNRPFGGLTALSIHMPTMGGS